VETVTRESPSEPVSSSAPATVKVTPHTRCGRVPRPVSFATPIAITAAGHQRMMLDESTNPRLSSVHSTPRAMAIRPKMSRPETRGPIITPRTIRFGRRNRTSSMVRLVP
jgi:hypothetical protein